MPGSGAGGPQLLARIDDVAEVELINPEPALEALARRLVVVAVIRNDRGDYLICKMPPDRGVFPGQWGLPGGGVEEGESIEAALRREVGEELGLEVCDVEPLFFTDGVYEKSLADGSRRKLYMVFLLYVCRATSPELRLNPEFSEAAWVPPGRLSDYDLNSATRATFERMELL